MTRDDDDYSERPDRENESGEIELGVAGQVIEQVLFMRAMAKKLDLHEVAYAIEKALAARGLLR